jgi:hypothetical protein
MRNLNEKKDLSPDFIGIETTIRDGVRNDKDTFRLTMVKEYGINKRAVCFGNVIRS